MMTAAIWSKHREGSHRNAHHARPHAHIASKRMSSCVTGGGLLHNTPKSLELLGAFFLTLDARRDF